MFSGHDVSKLLEFIEFVGFLVLEFKELNNPRYPLNAVLTKGSAISAGSVRDTPLCFFSSLLRTASFDKSQYPKSMTPETLS